MSEACIAGLNSLERPTPLPRISIPLGGIAHCGPPQPLPL